MDKATTVVDSPTAASEQSFISIVDVVVKSGRGGIDQMGCLSSRQLIEDLRLPDKRNASARRARVISWRVLADDSKTLDLCRDSISKTDRQGILFQPSTYVWDEHKFSAFSVIESRAESDSSTSSTSI